MGTCLQLCRTIPSTNVSFVPSVLQLRHRHSSSLSNFYHPNCLNLVNGKPLYTRSHFHSHPCQASAAWPYGNWESDEESEKLRRSWIDSFDWDGGLEVLAMVSGVAVSLAFLSSRRGASGIPVILFLMAGMAALRHQIGYIWKSVKAKSGNVQASMGEQLLKFQRNLRTWEDSISKKIKPQLFLKRSENHQRSPENAAGPPESPTTHENFGKSSIIVLNPSGINSQSEGHDRESCKESATPGTNIEVVVTDIAKCVAQLAEVVGNLEGKISNMESTGLQRKPCESVNAALMDKTSERDSSLELVNSLKEVSSTLANSGLPLEKKAFPDLGYESNDVMQNASNAIARALPLGLELSEDQRVDRSSVAFQEQQVNDTIPSDIYTTVIQNGVYAEEDLLEDVTKVQNMDTARSWREAVIRSRNIHSTHNTEEANPLVLEGGYKNLDASPPLNMDSPAHAAELDTDRVLSGGQVQRMGMEVTIASYSNKSKSGHSVPLDCGFTSLGSGDIEQESDSMLMEFRDFAEPEKYNLQVTEPGVWVNKEAGVRLPRDDATVNEGKVHLLERIHVVAEGPLGRMSGHFLPSESGDVSSSPDEGVPINGFEAIESQYIKGRRKGESCNLKGREPSSNKFNLTAGDWLTGFESDDQDSYNNSSIRAGSSLRNGDDDGNSQQKAMSSNRSRKDAAVLDVNELNFGVSLRPQYGTFVKESFGNREINLLRVASKEKTPIDRRGFEIRATQSSASRDDFSFSRGNANRMRDDGEEMSPQVGVSWEAQQSRNVTDESLYDRSERGTGMSSGSQESWEGPSSSGRDSDQRSRRGVSSEDANVEAFGRDGGYTEDTDIYNAPGSRKSGNDIGNRQVQQRSSRGSDIDSNSSQKTLSQESGTDPPAVRKEGSRPSSPSYPTEAYKNQRNLPVLRSKLPEDDRSQQIFDEVEVLLKEGREGLEGRIEVGVAERMLYEAADLCAKAVALRPSSLVAVGMWANTLLLHGELKLRLSQNLRSMLPEPSLQALSRRDSWEDEQERQALEATLQEVGEECEELLVEAGRKYRLALSMDRSDMRALYNWGLALCYRGQLIAEEGGESAAQDADKVYLAAIDKFEAMMGLSDSYASGALLNWGLAMRDRSRLRPMGSKERIKLLAQAKEIFQESLRLDPNYGQARGAVTACTVELKELQEYEEPRGSMDERETRGRQEGLWQPKNWWR